jgi:hypothetical protein
MAFYLVNAQHKFYFILPTNRTPNEMPQTETAQTYVTLDMYRVLPHTVKVTGFLVCQEQHKHAPTGIPNITKHVTPQNTLCTAKYHMMT